MSSKQKILKFFSLLLFQNWKIVESTKFDGLASNGAEVETKLEKLFSHVFSKEESLDIKPFY